ncbi:MAG: CinA family protein [Bdellovibrionia bacterium]
MMDELVSKLHDLCNRGEWTLSLAESCTGGLISSAITSHSGVSEFFLGSVVSYSNSVKEDVLEVPKSMLKKSGAVSAEVAIAMAKGVQIQMKSDWSLAVTGIAGPSGGSPEKPVGTVWFAIAGPNFEVSQTQIFTGNRTEIQMRAAVHALTLLVKAMGTQG